MTPTRLPFRPAWGLLLALLGAAACDLGAIGEPPLAATGIELSVGSDAPTFKIPPPRPPRRQRTNEEALAVYPLLESVGRDPFLTQAEEEALLSGGPVVERIVVAPPPAVKRSAPAPRMAGLENLPNEMTTILLGRGGKRMFVWRGATFEEGQEVGDYVIASIAEEAVFLKERTGAGSRTLRFKRDAASDWQKR